MGCFLGCFAGAKDDSKRRKKRGNRVRPQCKRDRVQNAQQENLVSAGQSIQETNHNLDSELRYELQAVEQLSQTPEKGTALSTKIITPEGFSVHQSTDFQPEGAISTDQEKQQYLKASSQPHSISGDENSVSSTVGSCLSNLKNRPKGLEKLSPSPKRVTFNSNVTMYKHVPVHESIDFQKDGTVQEDLLSQSDSISKDDNSVTSSVGSYPPNHRYYNARNSDDESEEDGNSDLDDMDYEDYEDCYDDDNDEDFDVRISEQEVWSESASVASMESRTGNHLSQAFNEEVENPPVDQEVTLFGSKTDARDRSNYNNSLLKPVENTTQWRAAKSRGQYSLKPQKENLVANFEPPNIYFSSETTLVTKSDALRKANQEIAVDASLSSWLSSPVITPSKSTTFPDLETIKSGQFMSEACASPRSFEDRPILGALSVEELKQISASASPRKSPSRSPDATPITGTVGTYWEYLGSAAKHSDSYKGSIPNKTSKYTEV